VAVRLAVQSLALLLSKFRGELAV